MYDEKILQSSPNYIYDAGDVSYGKNNESNSACNIHELFHNRSTAYTCTKNVNM